MNLEWGNSQSISVLILYFYLQLCFSSGTTDSIFGPTKNIWGSSLTDDEDFYIAGGSSGGSAVAVASGTCVA